ncbi:RCC1 domain-containing protein [Hyalangium minutum]|uniref:BNR repeat domain protein n=1 Tax=Hyalangium minutum TaxID=394096 RepID=A0A085WMW0_9BACT|nr:RCC1 domain-containing protein [Hyalangium minutum]KFE69023.1 BNR repeat domain protein [Hyalangium minutum]
MTRSTWFALETLWKLMMGLSLLLGWSARAEALLEPEQLAQGTRLERQQRAARQRLAASTQHGLVVSEDGEVWAWGTGPAQRLGTWPEQQLGNGLPARIPGLTGAVSVAADSSGGHSLALLQNGGVVSWGSNSYGELGDGTTSNRDGRVAVTGLANAVSVSAGNMHSMAVLRDGSVWTWGGNYYGQIGDGSRGYDSRRPKPWQVDGLTQFVAVAAGNLHSLALRADGTVWAWGHNFFGQLGDGTQQQQLRPVPVVGLTNVVAIATHHATSYAVRADGSVWAWGNNQSGELGGGSEDSFRATPGPVPGLTQVVSVAAGYQHALALRRDGSVWAWGDNSFGQLGNGEQGGTGLPQPVRGLNAVALAAATYHSLALRKDGSVFAWGHNTEGAMGTGTHARPSPAPVELKDVRTLSSSFFHTLALRADGSVWTWGSEQGWGGSIQPKPARVRELSRAVGIAAGTWHSLVLGQDGRVWAWGDNSRGQLGDGTLGGRRDTPARVPGLENVVAVAAGEFHSLALKRDGTVWAWGANHYSQLGDLTLDDQPQPAKVQRLDGVASIHAHMDLSVAVRNDGTVWQWGSDMGTWFWTDMLPHPAAPVEGFSDVIKVSVFFSGITALSTDGTVWQWYLGPPDWVFPPMALEGLTDAVDVVASSNTTQILRADGSVWNIGGNTYGERGFPSTDLYSLEVKQVPGLRNVVSLSSESATVYALRANGTLMAWGSNRYGTLGDGTSPMHLRPERVLLPRRY